MEIFPFFESIRLNNGVFELAALHQQRLQATQKKHFGKCLDFELTDYLLGFNPPDKGLFKCRLKYGSKLSAPTFDAYVAKPINSLLVVNAPRLDYASKFTDRNAIHRLYEQRQLCDDILIIQNGFVTDTSYCNIVFGRGNTWFTPDTPLLAGIQRENLLNMGKIKAIPIKISDVMQYESFRLVNAMIPWEESMTVEIEGIRLNNGQASL
jgi:4-amino-4-deoxychorismate lyase